MSGPATDYDDADEAALEAAFDDAWNDYDASSGTEPATGEPTRMTVTAEIEWAGELARTPMRTVNLEGLDLTKIRDALTTARRANDRAEHAGNTFTAKGWHTQLKELTSNARGHAATDRAGLTVTRETLVKWLANEGDPNPANQRRIADAYQDVRGQVIQDARDKAGRANHQLADRMSEALEREYGSEIRLRRIESIELYD